MACFSPLRAWRGTRDRAIYWRQVNDSTEIAIQCGQCTGCKLKRSREWATRCVHEAQMHRHNCMLTLTLADEHLTAPYLAGHDPRTGKPVYAGTLHPRDHVLFFKRLRKALSNGNSQIRSEATSTKKLKYYLGAEYGSRWRRPHYHACVFGIDFADKIYHCKSPAGAKLYRSPTLEKLWPIGYSTIGEVTFESAAYVARYIMKKITGELAPNHYQAIDLDTGEVINLKPEYNNMSRRPGIGKTWLEKFQTDVYPHGHVVLRGGHKTTPPRYYEKLYRETNPHEITDIKLKREMEARANWTENTHERLRAKKQVTEAKLKFLKRKI